MRSTIAFLCAGVFAFLALAFVWPHQQARAEAIGPAFETRSIPINDRLGIDHITYGGLSNDAGRYQLAESTGAGWNRWVAYWHDIERSQGAFDYSRYDTTVRADLDHGLQLEIVLMGTPGIYATTTPAETEAFGHGVTTAASAPRNLDKPIFTDGSDTPGAGKAINPDNYWARFVYNTVNRYKDSVRYWEMWNEPDNTTFWWNGDNQEVKRYVRLLKVGYLAAKSADPDAQVLLGGLMTWEWSNRTGTENAWLRAFLDEVSIDPGRSRYGSYFDILPLHWYARSVDVYDRTISARRLLSDAGIPDKAIWINETNLGVCGDPQLAGKPDCTPGVAKGRLDEQASFILQAFANALAAGVDKIFAFQLLDDSLGKFENYGLVRNDGSRRPAYNAFQMAATYFRNIKTAVRVGVPPVEMVTMVDRDGRVLVVAWNSDPAPVAVAIPARQTQATLIDQTGKTTSVAASSGAYRVTLPGATFSLNGKEGHPDYPVGGFTYVIAEKAPAPAPPSPQVEQPRAQSPTPQATLPAKRPSPVPQPPAGKQTPAPAIIAATPAMAAAAGAQSMQSFAPDAASLLAPARSVSAWSSAGSSALTVPASLSTLRISDIRQDGFLVSWVGSAPAVAKVSCGVDSPSADYGDVRGDVRSSVHFVAVRNLSADTAYRCQARAGVEIDDNDGAGFGVKTLPRSENEPGTRLAGVVVTEDGRPAAGAIVYATALDSRQGPANATVRAALSNEFGQWSLDVPGVDLWAGGQPTALNAVWTSGLSAERTVSSPDDLSWPMRLSFQWSLYSTSSVGLPRGLSDLTLPLVPLNARTIDDFAREVAAANGVLSDVYWWENGQWYGGKASGDMAPLVFGRQYSIRLDQAATWTLRGLNPNSLGLGAAGPAVVRFGLPVTQ